MGTVPTAASALRPRRMRFGLLPKFLVAISLLMTAVSVTLSSYFVRAMSQRLVKDLEARGNYLVRSLARTGQYGVFTSFPEILLPIAEGAFAAGDVFFVEIADAGGRPLVLKGSDPFDLEKLGRMSAADVQGLSTAEPRIVRLEVGRFPRYEFSYPVVLEKRNLASPVADDLVLGEAPSTPGTLERIGAVRVGLSLATLTQGLARVRQQALAMTLLIVAVSLALTAVLLRRIVSPILTLAEGARRISEGDFSFVARIQSGDEIGLLAKAFNEMSRRLGHYQQDLESQVAERTEALAAKTHDMEEFVYTVSHDLKAPVVSTHGLVSLLSDEYGPSLAPDARIYVDRIKANATHMEKLILDLFEMSRIDRPAKTRELVSVSDLVRDVLLEHDAQIREARVAVRVDAGLPDAWAERDHLTQVFENLIANAIKFRKPGREGRIEIGGRQEGDVSVFWVKDDGIGIDPRHHDKIFGLFQRLHTDREYPGTGLGLAIVKKIVEKHGGRVDVRSELGRGSEFTIRLPRPEPAAVGGQVRENRGDALR